MDYLWSMYGVSSDLEGNYYELTRKAKATCFLSKKQQEKGMKNPTQPKNLLGSVGIHKEFILQMDSLPNMKNQPCLADIHHNRN